MSDLEADCRFVCYKRVTAVTATHLPTGLEVTSAALGKSLKANKRLALQGIQEKLAEAGISKDYFNIEGDPVTLLQLCKSTPNWAASRILVMEREIRQVQAQCMDLRKDEGEMAATVIELSKQKDTLMSWAKMVIGNLETMKADLEVRKYHGHLSSMLASIEVGDAD